MADIEQALLQQLAESGSIPDSGDFAAALGQEHLKVVGTIKSLEAAEMVTVEVGCLLSATQAFKLSAAAAGSRLLPALPVGRMQIHRCVSVLLAAVLLMVQFLLSR